MPPLKLMTRSFARFVRKERISRPALAQAIARLSEGSVDADLGGGLFKQRVARPGQGRSGGWRTVLVYRVEDRAIFVHGFAKNAKSNLSAKELSELKRLAAVILAMAPEELQAMIENGDWREVNEDDGGEALQE